MRAGDVSLACGFFPSLAHDNRLAFISNACEPMTFVKYGTIMVGDSKS